MLNTGIAKQKGFRLFKLKELEFYQHLTVFAAAMPKLKRQTLVFLTLPDPSKSWFSLCLNSAALEKACRHFPIPGEH